MMLTIKKMVFISIEVQNVIRDKTFKYGKGPAYKGKDKGKKGLVLRKIKKGGARPME